MESIEIRLKINFISSTNHVIMHMCKVKTIIEVFLTQDMLNKVVSRTIDTGMHNMIRILQHSVYK